ncbi:MAG TPA: signal peptidase I [Vicinamibacterales bacterium]|nr:signal peptidase I [Vicinamibacterales bacterium]
MTGSPLARVIAGANPRRTAIRVFVLIVSAYVVFGYLLLPIRGVGVSMEPTIEPGDLIFVNRVVYRFRNPARGDVVAVRIAGPSVVYVKRLLGLPGDTVAFVDGVLWRNGEPLDEPYVTKRADWQLDEVTLGSDDYFVVGDNRGMAMAQHEFGTATRGRLIGPKVF